MSEQKQKPAPRSTAEISAGRPWKALSASERAEFGEAHRREALADAQALVDNLNRKTATKH
jgi:hypothetical protein